MDNCGDGDYLLQAYDLFTQEPLADASVDLAIIESDGYAVDHSVTPLGFIDDTTLELIAYERETYQLLRYEIDIEALTVTPNIETSQTLNETLSAYTPYIEFATYSPDHRYALASDDANSYLLDLHTGDVLHTVDTYAAFAAYSHDMQFVFITVFEDIEDYENYNGILTIYDLTQLPGAAPLDEMTLPSTFVFPSPNGTYLALQVNDSELGLFNIFTGEQTPLITMWEQPRPVQRCENTGADMSDVDFTMSGQLALTSLQWFPDSSGFITLNSYGGEGAQGGTVCYFNHSRLRHYGVSAN
jgi:WD40 repeat protein